LLGFNWAIAKIGDKEYQVNGQHSSGLPDDLQITRLRTYFEKQLASEIREPAEAPVDEDEDFIARVLGSTERVWTEQFHARNRIYEMPTLVLFSGAVQSGCGMIGSTMGSFYCPVDSRIYVDIVYVKNIRKSVEMGDLAVAFLVAREVGHHLQNLLGILSNVARKPDEESKSLSVRAELQATCFAGIWAHDLGESKEGFQSLGNKEALETVSHGRLHKRYGVSELLDQITARHRMRWFQRGVETGNIDSCDTFAEARPLSLDSFCQFAARWRNPAGYRPVGPR
jgi:uncharacterized protein